MIKYVISVHVKGSNSTHRVPFRYYSNNSDIYIDLFNELKTSLSLRLTTYHFNRGREQPTYTYPNNLIIAFIIWNFHGI